MVKSVKRKKIGVNGHKTDVIRAFSPYIDKIWLKVLKIIKTTKKLMKKSRKFHNFRGIWGFTDPKNFQNMVKKSPGEGVRSKVIFGSLPKTKLH